MNRHERRKAESQARKTDRREAKIRHRQAEKAAEQRHLKEQIRKILPDLESMATQMGAAFQEFAEAVKGLKFTTTTELESNVRKILADLNPSKP